MATFTYTRDRPNPPNNPSSDVPDMLQNTNSIDDILDVNHYSFGSASSNDGRHKFVEMPVSGAIPGGLITGEGTLYTKTSGESTLFYTPGITGNEYQLTRTITSFFPLFSTVTNNYTPQSGGGPVGVNFNGGWTFIPGGMLVQYGYVSNPTNGMVIKYPVNFSTFAVPILTPMRNNTDDKVVAIQNGSNTNTQFALSMSSSSLPTFVFWVAIGK